MVTESVELPPGVYMRATLNEVEEIMCQLGAINPRAVLHHAIDRSSVTANTVNYSVNFRMVTCDNLMSTIYYIYLQVVIYDVKSMSIDKDYYWRNDGFTWTGGQSKELPDSRKTWKVFYFNMVDQERNKVPFQRREYIRIKVAGRVFSPFTALMP